MPTPGNGDYRLREIERRLQSLEEKGSPSAQRLEFLLANERERRKDDIRDVHARLTESEKATDKRISKIENTQAAIGRWLAYIAGGIVVGVAVIYLTAGQG